MMNFLINLWLGSGKDQFNVAVIAIYIPAFMNNGICNAGFNKI
jgi:hypothetical protein